MLRAIEVPEIGGDTLFADMTAAYEGLDESVRERIDGREPIHGKTSVQTTRTVETARPKDDQPFALQQFI